MLDKDQQEIVDKGRDRTACNWGTIEDLLHGRLDWRQMDIVSKGRGTNTFWGQVEDLLDGSLTDGQMEIVSWSRGSLLAWGPVEDLLDGRMDREQMRVVSLGRGTAIRYANIDDLGSEVPAAMMELISMERANVTR